MQEVFVAAKALIQKERKFLFVIQAIGDKILIDLPGGKIEHGESPKQTVVREVKEETNLDVEVKSLQGYWWFFREKDNSQVICLTFSCLLTSGEVDISKNPSDETISSFLWLSKSEALAHEGIPSESFRELIEKLI